MDLKKIVQGGKFDLHMHTTASDGDYHPGDLVEKAYKAGLRTIAITDHDTVAGLEAALEAGKNLEINVIKGIELSTKFKGKTVDILGYNIASSAKLEQILQEMRNERENRAARIIKKFTDLGMPISIGDVNKHSRGDVIARPHIAKAIVDKGYVKDVQMVFDRFLADGKPCAVDKMIITPEEGIELIQEAGGIAVLAHPVLLHDDRLVFELLQFKFDGIEVWHRKQNKADNKRYKALASRFNLVMTGGSDFHNDDHQLGEFGYNPAD